jgi:hypothetical protein
MITRERLEEWKQGLEVQLENQLASLNATKGAIQMIAQLLEELNPEGEENNDS